jgi:hypothetical protein
MSGQQSENQFKWAQFTARRDDDNNRERRNDEGRDGVNARFDDVEVSTPRRGATTTRAFERHRRAIMVRFQDHRPVPAAAAAVADDEPTTTMCEPVERPRTRSARRAADAEAEREANAPAPAPMPKPTMKRVRRNDYWVERDDKRRNAAKTFKTNDRLIEEEYEEGMELED